MRTIDRAEEVYRSVVRRIIRLFMLGFGAALGYLVYTLVPLRVWAATSNGHHMSYLIGFVSGGGLLGFFVAPALSVRIDQLAKDIDANIKRLTMNEIVCGALGIITGLIIANLLAIPVASIPVVGSYLGIGLNLFLGYVGFLVAMRKREDIAGVLSGMPERTARGKVSKTKRRHYGSTGSRTQPKILDTSVIIDGRIADICKSGFMDGVLIVPSFILEELQHIADSSDVLKRNRGRRGLDILNKMQKDPSVIVQIMDTALDDPEVDSKLIRLGRLIDAKILTNDFNLNKVAELHGVKVLNINELANALKPVVLPGEEMSIYVIKDGKETGQGVGYLDDGTMVVVDGGRRHIGESLDVMVTSVLQTSAGRMIFAKPKALDRVAVGGH